MPGDIPAGGAEPDRGVLGFGLDGRRGQLVEQIAEDRIGLLHGDDVGVDLAQNREIARQIPPPVGAEPAADVIGSDMEHAA